MDMNTVMGMTPQAQVVMPNTMAQPQMFTQEQVNNIVASRVNSLNAKITQLQGEVATLTATSNNYIAELNGYKENEVLNKNHVPDMYKDFVRFSAQNLVNADVTKQKTFEVAVQEFIASNQTMFTPNTGVVNQPTVPTTPQVQPTAQTTPMPQINNGSVAQPLTQPNVQAQPVVQPQVVNTQPMTIQGINPQAQPVVQPIQQIANTQVANPQIANPQTMGTMPAVATIQTPVNGVDALVTSFLKGKGFN